MNGIEKNLCMKCNTVLINSALTCRSRRSEALMYLQEKNDQQSKIFKILNDFKTLMLCKSQTSYVLICFSKQKQNPSTPSKCKPWFSLVWLLLIAIIPPSPSPLHQILIAQWALYGVQYEDYIGRSWKKNILSIVFNSTIAVII